MSTNERSNATTGDYLDVVAFIAVGRDQKPQPRTVGYAKRKDEKLYVTMQLMPVPGAGWDGSLVIEKRREREQPAERDERPRGNGRDERPRR